MLFRSLSSDVKSIAKVLVVPMLEEKDICLQIATKLRNAGINTQIYFDDKKIKAKFKYADKLQIPFVIIIGEDEISNNTVTLKNMETGEQETLQLEQAIIKINSF